jgi:hypothetical protein
MDRRINPNRNSRNDVSYSRANQNINRYSSNDMRSRYHTSTNQIVRSSSARMSATSSATHNARDSSIWEPSKSVISSSVDH